MTTKQRTKCAYNLMCYLLPLLCALILTLPLLTGAALCTLLWYISTIQRMVDDGRIPEPKRDGMRGVFWYINDLYETIEQSKE